MPTLRVYAPGAAALDYIVKDDEPYVILLCRAGNISLRNPVMSCWRSPHSEISYRAPHRQADVVLTEHSVSCLMAVRLQYADMDRFEPSACGRRADLLMLCLSLRLSLTRQH